VPDTHHRIVRAEDFLLKNSQGSHLKWDYRINLNANLYPASPQVFNVWKYNRTWRAIVYEGSAARG
jgi:hypothetical protein